MTQEEHTEKTFTNVAEDHLDNHYSLTMSVNLNGHTCPFPKPQFSAGLQSLDCKPARPCAGSQARVNWSGCDEKGNQCKTGAGKLTGMAPPVPALTPARLKSRMIAGIFTDVGYPPWAFSRASRDEHVRVHHVVGATAECRDFEGD